jgi:hypothetical protein
MSKAATMQYSPFEDSVVKVKVFFMQDIGIAQTPEPIPPSKGELGAQSVLESFHISLAPSLP